MSRRFKKNSSSLASTKDKASTAKEHGFYTPFSCLKQYVKHKKGRWNAQDDFPETPPKAAEPIKEPESEETLFLKAVSDVKPWPKEHRERIPPQGPTHGFPRFAMHEDWEVLAHLADLVSGESKFSVHYSDEYMDGAVIGLNPSILKRLRNGDFSYQDHVDLHGLTRQEAQMTVTDFILRSHTQGARCVLIICGRGLNSKDKEPVLKRELVVWLTRAPLKRLVLAFASARTWDGGAGAVYVLLRRHKGKTPVRTPAL